MANVWAGGSVALDMLQPQFAFTEYFAVITGATNTTITLRAPSGHTQVLSGTFFYDANGIGAGSYIDGFSEYSGSTLLYRISNTYLPIQAWANFVVANNAAGQRHYLLFGNDSIFGADGNDRLTGLNGNDTIDGGAGADIAVFRGNRSNFAVTRSNGQITVSDQYGSDGTDTLINIEVLQFDDASVIVNRPPVANTPNYTPAHTAFSVGLSNFLNFSDADGDAIVRIEIIDNTAGGGRFSRNGVLQPEQQVLSIDATDFGSYDFLTDPLATTSVSIRAFDGYGWGAWGTFTINPRANALPTIAASALFPGKTEMSIAGPNLFSTSDADGDTISRYRVYDDTVGYGRFKLNGIAQTEKASIEIASSDLANLVFETDAATESLLWAQAYDGIAWGIWRSFTVAPRANATPVVSITQPVVGTTKGQGPIAASGFFSATDADGETVTKYRFFDEMVGNGRFTLYGVDQAEYVDIEINAADLTNLRFRPGPSGSDKLWVQAYDGIGWGTWKSLDVTAPPNVAPVVAVQNIAPAKAVTLLTGADLFTVSDPDDAAATRYRFFDGTIGNGRFQLNGTDQVEYADIDIAASDLANFRFRPGTSGPDLLWIQAFDGYGWSAWKSFTVAAPANIAPTITIPNAIVAPSHGTTSIAASTFFSVGDADGDTIAQYRLFDGTIGNGRFQLNGVDQAEWTDITVGAADLANVVYRTTASGGDVLWVQAFDGTAWSAWKSVNVAAVANAAPTIAIPNANVTPSHGATSLAASTLFAVTDADGDTITQYRFFDGTVGNGRFQLNGVDQVEYGDITINAGDLANFRFRPGSTDGDLLWVQAYDGTTWSTWTSFSVNAPANIAPLITVPNANVAPSHGTTSIDASTLFSASDPDGDTITQYRFFDGTVGNGRFELSGNAQAEWADITISAAQLANMKYRTSGTGSDVLWAQAFDGTSWSLWRSVNVAAVTNQAPVVTTVGAGYTPPQGTITINASTLFSASDPDGDAITQYRFFDGAVGKGRFELSGNAQAEWADITISAAQLANMKYRVSTTGSEVLWMQAFDGTSWSTWKSINVAAVSAAPIVSASKTQNANTAVAASMLFSVSDADPQGDSIAAWQIRDMTLGRGTLTVNGVAQADFQPIDVMANQLASVEFQAGGAPGFNRLWARASDSHGAWSEWTPFVINTLAPV